MVSRLCVAPRFSITGTDLEVELVATRMVNVPVPHGWILFRYPKGGSEGPAIDLTPSAPGVHYNFSISTSLSLCEKKSASGG
jgi:hypothetical protein